MKVVSLVCQMFAGEGGAGEGRCVVECAAGVLCASEGTEVWSGRVVVMRWRLYFLPPIVLERLAVGW